MAVPASVVMGAGLQSVYIYKIDPATGYIQLGTMAAPYAGYHVQGARVLTVNDPEARRITHVGDNRALGLTILPAIEFMSGELRTGKRNRIVDAVLAGINEITVGEAKFYGVGTDKRGQEAQVCLIACGNSQEADEGTATSGTKAWDSLILPKAQLMVREGSHDENALEMAYNIAPFTVTAYPWRMAFSASTEGYVQAAALTGISAGIPRLITAVGNATATKVTFPTGIVAVSIDKVVVFNKGTEVTTGITVTTADVTWQAAPATTDEFVILVESL
jgi:hypothetical protein